MKKRLLGLILALGMVVAIVPMALAEDGRITVNDSGSLQNAISSANGQTTIVLDNDITASITIDSDKDIILDLNGYTLKNSDKAQPEGTSGIAHTITNNGTLTIMDSSEEGTGTVDNVSHGVAAVQNNSGGIVTLNGGTYTRSAEAGSGAGDSGKNSYYTLLNHGTMTINDGVTVNQGVEGSGRYSSLVENGWYDGNDNTGKVPSIMIINGGTFSGGLNTIKNDDWGELTINNGNFVSFSQACLLNWNVATIEGGTFDGTDQEDGQSAILNGQLNNSMDKGQLTINGGTFTGEYILQKMNQGNATAGTVTITDGTFTANIATVSGTAFDNCLTITGGTFPTEDSDNISEYIPKGMILNPSTGEVIIDTKTAVAEVNGVGYPTLQDAIDSAPENGTVTVLKDVEVASVINAKKVLTFQGAPQADGSKPVISSAKGGIFSQSGNAQYTLVGLELKATRDDQWYIYHNAGKLTINNCDFTMANGVTHTGNVIMGEGSTESDSGYSLTFTDNTITANSRAAITGIGNNSVITGNVIDLINEKWSGDDANRTSVLALTASAGGGKVTIVDNIFKNANRALAVDNSTLAANDLTYNQNQFIDVRFAFELDPAKNKDCGIYDINENYYCFDGVVSEPKIQDASSSGDKFDFGDGSTEYRPDGESQVENEIYYTAPTMRPEDLNTYIPPIIINPSYAISVPATANGAVTVSPTSAKEDQVVTITVTPDSGYELTALAVTDFFGNQVDISRNSDGTYSFVMPASQVTVSAVFAPAQLPFTDVTEANWYYDEVYYVWANGLMQGTSATTFGPNVDTTRAMVVTILWRLEGEPASGYDMDYSDVAGGAWYAGAVRWATEHGIVNGSEGQFYPGGTVTREQLAAMLYRYAQYKGYDLTAGGDLSGFADAGAVSGWAETSLAWAVGQRLIQGSANQIDPTGSAIRAQLAAILMRFMENVAN